ncbi:MAG: helix-turn-helix transcriptional regulator [Anaerolineales bacterium]
MDPQDCLNTAATARRLGIAPQTLRSWRLKGIGPVYIRLGEGPRARCVYRYADVETWLRDRAFRNISDEQAQRALKQRAGDLGAE